MRRHGTGFVLALLLYTFCATAHASSVTLVSGGESSDLGALAALDGKAIILTFGDEFVVVHEDRVPVPGRSLTARDVSPSELFIVRDRRPVAERAGYEAIYSHCGFQVAIVKEPEQLAGAAHVSMWPIAGNMVVTEKPEIGKVEPDPSVEQVLSLLRPAKYRQYMSALAAELPTRYACGDGEPAARDIIKHHFSDLGLAPNQMWFKNKCWPECEGKAGFNVIGLKLGSVRPNELYLVGAHYDSISGNPCLKAPGANDNASGAAGVMELARVFSQVDTEASIIFVAFSGEEQGMVGSTKYVRSLIESGLSTKLKGFIVLDMISYYKANYEVLIEGSGATVKQRAVLDNLARLASTYTDLGSEITTMYGGSDHEPFLDKGMAGCLLIETDWSKYDYYHTTMDRMGYQNIPYGMEIVKLAAAFLAKKSVAAPISRPVELGVR